MERSLLLLTISKQLKVLIDFIGHEYYGKRSDKTIKRTNKGGGTRNMLQYLGFSILSRGIHLYTGLEIKFVLMDIEFYNVELKKRIKAIRTNILVRNKSFPKI